MNIHKDIHNAFINFRIPKLVLWRNDTNMKPT